MRNERPTNKYLVDAQWMRHGPKVGEDGPLTEAGKIEVAYRAQKDWEGIPLDPNDAPIHIYYSPITRAQETAFIYGSYLASMSPLGNVVFCAPESALSEGEIAHHEDILYAYGGMQGKWIEGWLNATRRPFVNIETGEEVARKFCILMQYLRFAAKINGASNDILFGHGPSIVVWMLVMERKYNQNLQEDQHIHLLPDNWQEKDIFSSIIPYLKSIKIQIPIEDQKNMHISINGETTVLPLTLIDEIIENPDHYFDC